MPLKIGIIGFGRIGNEHAGWIDGSRNARVVAVQDVTEARRAMAAGKGLRATTRIDELLGDSEIDAVLIATPTAMHFDHASAALAAGKHVMIEKPMTLDYASSAKLVEQARVAGKVISVFHNRRWDIDYLTVKSAIDSGLFGKLINIESRLGQWNSCVGPAAREWNPGWRNEGSFGGGGLYDWGSHFVDQIWQLMLPARPIRVFAQLRANVWSSDCDDFARVSIDFDNGAVAMVEINTTTTRPLPRWHIDGEYGSADSPYSLAFDTNQWAQLTFSPADQSREHPVQPQRQDPAASEDPPARQVPRARQVSPARQVPTAAPGLSETQIWEAFADACQGSGLPAVDPQSVLVTMQLLDAARVSSAQGRAIAILNPVQ